MYDTSQSRSTVSGGLGVSAEENMGTYVFGYIRRLSARGALLPTMKDQHCLFRCYTEITYT